MLSVECNTLVTYRNNIQGSSESSIGTIESSSLSVSSSSADTLSERFSSIRGRGSLSAVGLGSVDLDPSGVAARVSLPCALRDVQAFVISKGEVVDNGGDEARSTTSFSLGDGCTARTGVLVPLLVGVLSLLCLACFSLSAGVQDSVLADELTEEVGVPTMIPREGGTPVGVRLHLPFSNCHCNERRVPLRDSSCAGALGDRRGFAMSLVSSGLSMSNTTKDYVTVGDWLNQPRGEWVSQQNSSSTSHMSAISDQLTYGSDSIYRLYDAIAALLTRISSNSGNTTPV